MDKGPIYRTSSQGATSVNRLIDPHLARIKNTPSARLVSAPRVQSLIGNVILNVQSSSGGQNSLLLNIF